MSALMNGLGAPEDARGIKGAWIRAKQALGRIDLNPETAFRPKRPPPAVRRVLVNLPLPSEAYDSKGRVRKDWTFVSNQVTSSKYTLYNFIFKNLLEQFRRVANIFFLGVAMLPLLFVLAITMVKDGYEDIKRHQSDRSVNLQRARVLNGGDFKNHNVTQKNSAGAQAITNLFRRIFSRRPKGSSNQADPNVSMVEHPNTHQGAPDAPRIASPEPMSPQNDDSHSVRFSSPNPNEIGEQSARRSHARPSLHQDRSASVDAQRRRTSLLSELTPHQHHPMRWRSKHWQDLHVGDIVKLHNNEEIPADLVVCATSHDDGSCFVETKNLDGEINLKTRYAVPELSEMASMQACATVPFEIEVEPQNTDMYRFNARVELHDELNDEGKYLDCPVTLNQVLLRGCSVRNTDWVIGVVAMTGLDSKIVLNSGDTPSKRSKMEYIMNDMVYINLFIIAVIAVVCAIADAQLEKHYFNRGAYWEYGAVHSDDNPRINGLIAFANSLITFQNFVPIALYISFEVVRTIQAILIFEDHDMYYEKASRRTTAKSWNLSDELGQIQYILSDKTGTLTQNLMIFRECSVAGKVYRGETPADEKNFADPEGSQEDRHRMYVRQTIPDIQPYINAELTRVIRDASNPAHKASDAFFHCLSLCHTVHIAKTDQKNVITYRAESPDEQALVQTAADNGYVYCGRHINTVELQVPLSDTREKYEMLHTIEFSSARKRMSVILRRASDQQLILYCKGADSMIYSRLAPNQEQMKTQVDDNLEEFANRGLRTLCVGQRTLDLSYYQTWAQRYQEASVATHQREERMEELASEIECQLELLGATAIEDRLQDGVPETIADLKRAGINIWVATGDKLETAIAIGYSTKLLSQDMKLVIIRGGEYGSRNSAYLQLKRAIERFFGGEDTLSEMKLSPPATQGLHRTNSQLSRASSIDRNSLSHEQSNGNLDGYALVIDGHALGYALEEPYTRELLLRVAIHCQAVVCCRVSPLQKALIVHLVREGLHGITLAIGDGANDVSMIQAAHVGVGVAGEEGLQAVNSSDYAIGQFRFLKRLLLVHGHWSYYRNSKMINLFFYKQVVHVGTLFWFQIYCAWSTTQAMDYVYLLLYNAVWTVAPVIAIGLFDRNVSDRVLMQVPELYARSREGRYFGLKQFLFYMLDGVYQSVVLFFFFFYVYDTTSPRKDGYDIDLYEPSTGMIIATVLAANLYCGLDTLAWTWWIVFSVFIGPVLLFIFAPIYSAFTPAILWTYTFGNNQLLYPSLQFWIVGILAVCLSLLPRFLYEYIRMQIAPNDIDLVRILDSRDPNHDYIRDPRMPGLRAAQAYEPEAEIEGDITNRSVVGDSYPLMPTQSRGSSRHYDMSTGQESVYRGYSYAASDTPSEKPRSTLRRIGRRLQPKHWRNKRRAEQAGLDQPYVRAREQPSSPALQRGISGARSDQPSGKRESLLDDTLMHENFVNEEPIASGQDAGLEPPFVHPDMPPSVSDTFYTVIEPDSSAGQHVPTSFDSPNVPSNYNTPRVL
ncbi:P-type phospholipid transporter [Malassezia psittaci]|uniref:Phospholipid-transporting ATPase n=1 Tax=Malassezia psittaci TaxID=1821823 RepID=A0AAF0F8W3_9BASI|nr:P-type phospholipid transporter [Malassezia psittaci]